MSLLLVAADAAGRSAAPSLIAIAGGTMADAKLAIGGAQDGVHRPRPSRRRASCPTVVTLADKARREGLLALEDYAQRTSTTRSWSSGVTMAVDGTDPEELREILEAEVHAKKADDQAVREVLQRHRRLRADHRHHRHRHGPGARAGEPRRAREARPPDRRRVRRDPVGRPVGQRASSCRSATGSSGSASSRPPGWSSSSRASLAHPGRLQPARRRAAAALPAARPTSARPEAA